MEKFTGNKISLAPIEEQHYEKFAEFMNELEGTIYTNTISDIYTAREEAEYFSPESDKRQFAIVTKEEEDLLGVVELFSIDWIHRNAVMGVFIGDGDFRNQGIGYDAIMLLLDYAFDILNLHSIQLTVGSFNQRAKALYEKCGFKYAGILREHRKFAGEYSDTIYMDILREEHQSYVLNKSLKKIIE